MVQLPKLRNGRVLDGPTLETLRLVQTELANLHGNAKADSGDLANSYQLWVESSLYQLSLVLTDEELGRLVRTELYYWFTASMQTGVMTHALRIEIRRLSETWDRLIRDCLEYRQNWQAPAHILVPDTNVWIEYPERFDEIDWRALAGLDPGTAVRLVLLMPVFDELDKKKNDLRGQKKDEVVAKKKRLRCTLKILMGYFNMPGVPRHLLRQEANGFGETSIDLVLDDPGNVRLPIMDNEIVKQSSLLGARTALPLQIVTADPRMVTTARGEGLDVVFTPNEDTYG